MERRAALIISNGVFDDPALTPLSSATHDARQLASVLSDTQVGGFSVSILVDKNAEELRVAAEDFFADAHPGDLLLLYYSGHGIKDDRGRLYFTASNTRLARPRSSGIVATYFSELAQSCRANRQVIIIDSCFSGALPKGMLAKAPSRLNAEDFVVDGRGQILLTASTAFQYAFEGESRDGIQRSSVFTKYLIQGLQTGDADLKQDGEISVDELYEYTYGKVRQEVPSQTPQKWVFDLSGDIVLAKNRSPRTVELPDELMAGLSSSARFIREATLKELVVLAESSHEGRKLAAVKAIEKLARDDDSASLREMAAEFALRFGQKKKVSIERPSSPPPPPPPPPSPPAPKAQNEKKVVLPGASHQATTGPASLGSGELENRSTRQRSIKSTAFSLLRTTGKIVGIVLGLFVLLVSAILISADRSSTDYSPEMQALAPVPDPAPEPVPDAAPESVPAEETKSRDVVPSANKRPAEKPDNNISTESPQSNGDTSQQAPKVKVSAPAAPVDTKTMHFELVETPSEFEPDLKVGEQVSVTMISASELAAYTAAFKKWQALDFMGAIEGFDAFLRSYPNSQLASHAYYWLGLSYLHIEPQDLNYAQQSFEKVLQYPLSKRAPEALYELGKLYYLKGDKVRAKEVLQRAIYIYGDSSSLAPKLAQQFISQNSL